MAAAVGKGGSVGLEVDSGAVEAPSDTESPPDDGVRARGRAQQATSKTWCVQKGLRVLPPAWSTTQRTTKAATTARKKAATTKTTTKPAGSCPDRPGGDWISLAGSMPEGLAETEGPPDGWGRASRGARQATSETWSVQKGLRVLPPAAEARPVVTTTTARPGQ